MLVPRKFESRDPN